MRRFPLLFVLTVIVAAGCTYRLGDFTTLSSKNVPVRYDVSTTSHGRVCKVVNILGIPLGFPSLKDAADQAIGNQGNALVNEVTYTSNYTFILGQTQCIEVKGDVVMLR